MKTLAMAQAAATMSGAPDLYPTAVRVLAVKLFDDGVLSLGRAAELAGLPLTDFMELCSALHVPVYRTPRHGLDAEVAACDAWIRAGESAKPEPGLGD